MLDQIMCPYCDRTGFVRVEQVITGETIRLLHYCGACDRDWLQRERAETPLERAAKAPPRVSTRNGMRLRSAGEFRRAAGGLNRKAGDKPSRRRAKRAIRKR